MSILLTPSWLVPMVKEVGCSSLGARPSNLLHHPHKRSVDLTGVAENRISRRALAPGLWGGLETLNRGLTPSG